MYTEEQYMWAKQKGFTIVELLIVIVVIAILAAISVVAYSSIQKRAQDSKRASDVTAIMKALELYKTDRGYYPNWNQDSSWVTGASFCGVGHTNGYSYSTATDGSFMKPLKDGGYLPQVPLSPVNDCTSFYRYLNTGSPTSYGCTTRTKSWYVILVENANGPPPTWASNPTNGDNWKPCPEATVGWGYAGSKMWVFAKDDI